MFTVLVVIVYQCTSSKTNCASNSAQKSSFDRNCDFLFMITSYVAIMSHGSVRSKPNFVLKYLLCHPFEPFMNVIEEILLWIWLQFDSDVYLLLRDLKSSFTIISNQKWVIVLVSRYGDWQQWNKAYSRELVVSFRRLRWTPPHDRPRRPDWSFSTHYHNFKTFWLPRYKPNLDNSTTILPLSLRFRLWTTNRGAFIFVSFQPHQLYFKDDIESLHSTTSVTFK